MVEWSPLDCLTTEPARRTPFTQDLVACYQWACRTVGRTPMKDLMHSVRAQLIAGYVAALLLLGLVAIGATMRASTVSHEFIQAVQTDRVLRDIILLRTKLVDDEETALRGYLLTHDTRFLVPYTTARRLLPDLRTRSARLGTAVPGLPPLLVSMRQRVLAWERWARQLLVHPPAGPSPARIA